MFRLGSMPVQSSALVVPLLVVPLLVVPLLLSLLLAVPVLWVVVEEVELGSLSSPPLQASKPANAKGSNSR